MLRYQNEQEKKANYCRKVVGNDGSYLPKPAIQWTAMQGISSSSSFVLGSKVDDTTSLHCDMTSLGGLAPSSKNISCTIGRHSFCHL